jgi:oligopeptide/dipeptide ABC transporter ATP-binding protein
VRHLAHDVAVMYAGRVVEAAPAAQLFATPAHPYTRALLAAAPRTEAGARRHAPLTGEPPDPTALPPGCHFANRCPEVREACRHGPHPALLAVLADHYSACPFAGGPPAPPRPEMEDAAPSPAERRIAVYRRARDAGARAAP